LRSYRFIIAPQAFVTNIYTLSMSFSAASSATAVSGACSMAICGDPVDPGVADSVSALGRLADACASSGCHVSHNANQGRALLNQLSCQQQTKGRVLLPRQHRNAPQPCIGAEHASSGLPSAPLFLLAVLSIDEGARAAARRCILFSRRYCDGAPASIAIDSF
jgi:hypothetical protein